MLRSLAAISALFIVLGCDDGEPECEASYGETEAEVRRGGWDRNGRTLFALRDGAPQLSGSSIERATLQGRALEIFDINHKGLVARSEDGRVLSGAELEGTTLTVRSADDQAHELLVERSVAAESFVRYQVRIDGEPACPEGQVGAFLEGYWNDQGHKRERGISFACETGAAFKCADWGWAPWSDSERHQSCTRMVRADYCGDGRSFTRDGTPIMISEIAADLGTQREAGWGPRGAVCVDHARFSAFTASGEELLPECFADLPSCEGDDDALLYNASQSANLTVCE